MNAAYPRISVITPSLNHSRFIERCINSVISQDYPDTEYIIIDGGSTDGSLDIIKKYEGYLSRWVSTADRGQVNAINAGLSKATGDIVAWLNCDDFYYPGALKRIAAAFSGDPSVDMVYGDACIIDCEGRVLIKQVTDKISLRLLSLDCYLAQPSVFLKKTVFEKIGFLNESLDYCFDYDLWIRAFKHCLLKYIPLTISAITASTSYGNKTYSNWTETIKYTRKIQIKHFGSQSVKLYAYLSNRAYLNQMPNLNGKGIKTVHLLLGIVKYVRYNITAPGRILKQLIAVSELLALRLFMRKRAWRKIR